MRFHKKTGQQKKDNAAEPRNSRENEKIWIM